MKEEKFNKGKIIIYKTSKYEVKLDVRLEEETVWLSQKQMAALFNKGTPTINEHIKNIYRERELSQSSTIRKFRIVQKEGGRTISRNVDFYNLDVIISVGYRVKSQRGTQFRIWATKTLKNHLIRGYTVNEKRLLQAENKFKELQEAVSFLREKSKHEILSGQEKEILGLLADYSKTLTLLEQYDTGKLLLFRKVRGKFKLSYEKAGLIISEIKKELINKKEASGLFGQECDGKLKGVIGAIYQSFGGKELYFFA